MSSKTETSASLNSPAETPLEERCRHFGDCGGCRLQDKSYEAQVEHKAAYLTSLAERISWQTPVKVYPSPEHWFYRNKMEFAFQDVFPAPAAGEDSILLGLKRRNRWDKVMNLEECRLQSPDIIKLLDSVHAWARKEKLEPYNIHKHKGFLRHLVVREGKNTDEKLVNLLTGEGDFPKESFISAVRDAYPATTILRGVTAGKNDVAVSETVEALYGPGFINEKALGKTYRISPYAFFQTNTHGAELLYGLIREWMGDLKASNVLDLYCGGGAIGMSVSDMCDRVMGIEVVESAIEDARHNAEVNKITNVDYLAAKVEDVLPGLAAQKIEVDGILIDPPRSGIHPNVRRALKELSAPWLIYVSCNPKAMIEDLRAFSDIYDLHKLVGVDLFPHTDHLESVALLRCIYS
jgi:23S rRNA (uracil1939-C5)-methyltransferase